MKLGVVITMYDEYEQVLNSMVNIKRSFPEAYIVVIQSECELINETLMKIIDNANEYTTLPDLSHSMHRYELPTQAICRNLSVGFRRLYATEKLFDIIVAFTGDSLVTDADSFFRRFTDMIRNKWVGMVSQALGQDFHSSMSNPINGHHGGRYQDANSTDFACCFFILDGRICTETRAFAEIPLTNKWTSEQCLGDELVRVIGGDTVDFRKKVGILNSASPYMAYSYNDGLIYHAKTGSPSR